MPDDANTPEGSAELASWNRAQLDEEAARLGIEIDRDWKKADVLSAIEQHRAENSDAQAGDAPAAEASEDGEIADQPAGDSGIPSDVAAIVGEGAALLDPFARQAAEMLSVGLEGVVAHKPAVSDISATVTDYATIEAEFADVPHMGFELRVALSETEAFLAAALVDLDGVGALFMIDTAADKMEDEAFATAQVQTVSAGTRELLDLASLTLFAGGLSDAEATLSDARYGQADFTMGMVADVAQGAPAVRVGFSLVLPDGSLARVVLVLPATLLSRIADLLDAADAAASDDPGVTQEAPGDGHLDRPGFGLSDEGLNVTPLRPEFGDPGAPPFEPSPPGMPNQDEVPVHPVRFPDLGQPVGAGVSARSIDLLMDVSMRVTVELGRSSMTVEEILSLGPGSVVELNKLAGEPVDILVNERLIARGEVVVVDENFGVRVTEIISPRSRAHALGR